MDPNSSQYPGKTRLLTEPLSLKHRVEENIDDEAGAGARAKQSSPKVAMEGSCKVIVSKKNHKAE